MAQIRASSPRFALAKNPPGIRLTPDDEQIIWNVYRHRLMSAYSIYSFFPTRTQDKIGRRLNLLRNNRYLTRLPQQKEKLLYRPGGGSDYLIYGLGDEGARWLADHHGVKLVTRGWSTKNKSLGWKHINHTVSTSGYIADTQMAEFQNDHIEIIHFDEITRTLAPEENRRKAVPLKFRTPFGWRGQSGEIGIEPDWFFGLRLVDGQPGKDRAFYFFEMDMGTESIVPKNVKGPRFLQNSTPLQKMVIYSNAFRHKAHKKAFGIETFRVLFMTSSPERVRNMQEAWKDHLSDTRQPGLFLFADFQTRQQHQGDLLSMPWQTASGRDVYLDGRTLPALVHNS